MLSSFAKILLYFLLCILLFSEKISSNNAYKIISDNKYPIILKNNNLYYNIITSTKIFIIDKNSNSINETKEFGDYNPMFFICVDESNNYFLLANYKYYKINLNSQFKIQSFTSKNISLPKNFEYSGYIQQNKFIEIYNTAGARCGVGKNEIIIYGKKGKYIYFYFINKEEGFFFEISNKLENNISCKLIEDVKYICSYFVNSNLKII